MAQTETNITQHNKSKLMCFELRFAGNTYRQIEEIMRQTEGVRVYSNTTLEIYFCEGGLWRKDYDEWVSLRKDDINEQVTGMFVAQATAASQVLTNIMTKENAQDKDKIAAAKEILDRGGFASIQRIKNESEAESVAEQILKGMEAQKLANKTVKNDK